jgi:hypothetical protein
MRWIWLVFLACSPAAGREDCEDGIDNDSDTMIDGRDPECGGSASGDGNNNWNNDENGGGGGGCLDDDCETTSCVWDSRGYWRSCPGEDCPCANN